MPHKSKRAQYLHVWVPIDLLISVGAQPTTTCLPRRKDRSGPRTFRLYTGHDTIGRAQVWRRKWRERDTRWFKWKRPGLHFRWPSASSCLCQITSEEHAERLLAEDQESRPHLSVLKHHYEDQVNKPRGRLQTKAIRATIRRLLEGLFIDQFWTRIEHKNSEIWKSLVPDQPSAFQSFTDGFWS